MVSWMLSAYVVGAGSVFCGEILTSKIIQIVEVNSCQFLYQYTFQFGTQTQARNLSGDMATLKNFSQSPILKKYEGCSLSQFWIFLKGHEH